MPSNLQHLNLPRLLLQAREAVLAHTQPDLRRHGLSDQQWRVLRVLVEQAERPGGTDTGEVAREAHLLGPSLTGVLNRMERDGLVSRQRCPTDGRRTLVSATPRGLAMALGGCETLVLMPTADKPYRLATETANRTPTPWTWVDARSQVVADNTSTRDGVVFGDAVMEPRPYPMLQQLFQQAVRAHPAAAELTNKLRDQTIHLEHMEVSVGLWNRLS